MKQYEINLPADYDMSAIRNRVAEGGPSFDSFPGLALKCFLIRAVGIDPRSWGLVRFDHWARPPGDHPAAVQSYEVLHCSARALAELAA